MRTLGAALRKFLGLGLTACLVALVACSSALPPPRVVDEAPQLARVAELLNMPPLRPVPEAMAELRPPYPCGKQLYQSRQFAADAGVVIISGMERYAVMDIATGDVLASGASKSGGMLSPNGRVVAVQGEGGLELRSTESGEVVVLLQGATLFEHHWIGDHGSLHVAPPAEGSKLPRVVYLDLATGLETSLLTVPGRDEDEAHEFGAVPLEGADRFSFEARRNVYELTLVPGAAGVTATLGRPHAIDFGPTVPQLIVGSQHLTFEDEAVDFHELPNLNRRRIALPGFFPSSAMRTGDPDRILISGYFRDEARELLKENGVGAWRHFYFSVSSHRLAPVEMGDERLRLGYVRSMRSHVITDEHSLRPYTLPPGGEEGDIATVLAAAKGAIQSGAITQEAPM
ncbi:MAG: hypothetical protein NT046_00295 [Arenimonas sp.]|nr:hypothetical protein [Arenimonas sp.]